MSFNQFLITAFFAAIGGALLCLIASLIVKKVKTYYKKITFKHEYLIPYKYENKKDKS